MSKPYHIRRFAILIVAGIALLVTSCKKDEVESLKPSLAIPLVYDSTGFSYNSEPLKPLIQQYTNLIQEAEKGRQTGTYVSEETLNAAFTQGNFSLQSATTPYYTSQLRAQNNGFFAELSKASGGNFYPFDRSWEGGVYRGYLFDEYGLEMGQMIEKGMYGATLYNYAVSLIHGTFTTATADQILFLYGSNPKFFNSDNSKFYSNPDKLMAAYAAQRDDATGTGLYSQIRLAFITLQAALKGGEDYNEYRDEALAAIKLNWEKTNAATVIHILQEATALLNATDQDDQKRAESLHLISEAIGFLHGWRTIDITNKTITDAQIDDILVVLKAPYNRSSAVYRFVTNSAEEAPKLKEAIGKIQAVYGFTNDEVESFRHNYVAEQGR
ncbi:DUF4856 domain-containing protein [Larkinella terrae]|nr:DUF4856 domain-containing protein [Larkinella terrae]